MSKGQSQRPGQPYCDFADAVSRARADFLTAAAARQHQLAVGGVIKLPVMDKQGNPVRMHTADCKTPNSCRCEVLYVDKVVMPSERALEFELGRLDPIGPVEQAVPEPPGRTRAEIEAEGARYVDLFYNSVKVLVDLGMPLPQIAPPARSRRRRRRSKSRRPKRSRSERRRATLPLTPVSSRILEQLARKYGRLVDIRSSCRWHWFHGDNATSKKTSSTSIERLFRSPREQSQIENLCLQFEANFTNRPLSLSLSYSRASRLMFPA